ncbi:hypothetical protein [Priestia flexa]|uniref:hypothetical protein n=1 Tax=Priestia flexa TaxID=86664 RepID=UPI001B32E4A8|nr:hypothetical protein [Priestia flexa]
MKETMKPNYKELGHADILGPKLKDLVEKQLLEDLKFYVLVEKSLSLTDLKVVLKVMTKSI